MATSKLIPLSSFPPQAPLPTLRPPSTQVHLNPFKNPSPLTRLKAQLTMIPVSMSKISPINETEERQNPYHHRLDETCSDSLAVAFPSLRYCNTLFYRSTFTVEVIPVDDDEPLGQLVDRFNREVRRTRVVQECKRRRFFETTQEKRKRKRKEAARRNKIRRPLPEQLTEDKAETKKNEDEDFDEGNWKVFDVDLPYC